MNEKRVVRTGCGCEILFSCFKSADFTQAKPEAKKGVYVLRINSKTEEPLGSIIKKVEYVVSRIGWKPLEDKVKRRMERLRKIDDMPNCPTIYIGSAGTNPKSKNTLQGRYREFTGRHTAMFPVWALLYSGWKLEYLWLCCDNPATKEEEYKKEYKRLHGGRLPPLVKK